MKRFLSLAAVSLVTISFAACATSEQRAIEKYFTKAQSIAERLVTLSTNFQTLVDAQEDPLAWSDESKGLLEGIYEGFTDLEEEAKDMSVPPALADVHPLLVEALGDMSAAVKIMVEIANDPSQGTETKANEMTSHAANAEKLSGEYVKKLQETLEAKYPELLQDQ